MFSFGETDIYDQVEPVKGSLLAKFQKLVKNFAGFSPVIFFGRGIFNYSFGIIPRRMPVTVVGKKRYVGFFIFNLKSHNLFNSYGFSFSTVGKPIDVERVKNPTKEQIDDLHQKFKESLLELFNEEKHKYVQDPTTKLIIN